MALGIRYALRDVLVHRHLEGAVSQRDLGLFPPEVELLRHLEQPLEREALPAGEQQRMRVPELAVGRSQLRQLGGEVGAGVELRIGVVAPDQLQAVVALEQRLDGPP